MSAQTAHQLALSHAADLRLPELDASFNGEESADYLATYRRTLMAHPPSAERQNCYDAVSALEGQA